ncbi:HEAT repeat domain-containing protein (plasmid) [Haloferax mediterranei ATCC 33500]|uniref:HEAT repeat domain-containing protein n=1 Tax=Haloferax mediterranei (strain ATCC 33500 / DSM 1411 / JCM 8866 / NBRC 14739 / NCIMB 2177 / R-4) TaxID=523841 RepID=I3R9M4_HALMT|nr:HEAT repeat domain-containing protein [Haloferax mediterranei]AFK20934.1 protein phosphatase [Haloferax mediterranei ATCC 33500]AHZ24197.1 protein phosphatase [Haloferax mediterranei ATCC 33500]EMA05276.1 protein phosphatase [Haloferax mediterranei ATCC 33500]MDX5989921.1 HEAT repeat domain-containing protein [Haloferax mediterranei ATCC 33500]QCQ77113.1 HEAT repeat domain-containing protein [Haloferax mediterranei ATCC 33500]
MRDEEEATDGPPDPQLHPERSPGFGTEPAGFEDIEVDRDVTIGEASLAELGASDTEPVENDAVSDLLASLAGDDVIERRRAALALAEREQDERIVRALRSAATTDDDAEVRQFSVEALAKHGGSLAAQTARTLTDDPEPWVRAEAVVALDRLDRDEHEDVIASALDDEHHAVRRNAIVSLFKLRGEDTLSVLVGAADDPSERVREWVAHLLGGIDHEQADETLVELTDDESSIVRETAIRAREVDAGSFRRQFTGVLDETDRTLPGEDDLNRTPNL